jgi:hypothetical protein
MPTEGMLKIPGFYLPQVKEISLKFVSVLFPSALGFENPGLRI